MSQHDDHNDLDALDFYGAEESEDHSGLGSDALDFSPTEEVDAEQSAADALDEFAPADPEAEDPDAALEAIDSVTEPSKGAEEEPDELDGAQMFSVANPLDTVSVIAMIDGRTQRVRLSPTVTNMTESELAEEVVVLAELARKKGLAGQHTYLMDNAANIEGLQELSEIGWDGQDFLQTIAETGLQLPTPQQADEAQAEVFASRYGTNGE